MREMIIIMKIDNIQEMVKIMIIIIYLEEEEIIMDKIIKMEMTIQKIEKMKKMEI